LTAVRDRGANSGQVAVYRKVHAEGRLPVRRFDAPLDASQECVGGGEVLLAGEQKSDIYRNSSKDNGRQAFLRAGYLNEQVLAAGAGVQILCLVQGAGCVIGQQGRDLLRDPAVGAIGLVKDRRECVRGASDIVEGKPKEEVLAGFSFLQQAGDGRVIRGTVLDGVIEDGRVRRSAR
jgi:hypothetical protein